MKKGFHLLTVLVFFAPLSLFSQWTIRAASPNPRWGPCSCYLNNYIYLFGGNNGATVGTVDRYDPATNTWTTLAPMPQITSYCAAVGASNGKIYVFGGANGSTWLNNTQEYDPATNTWTARAPMPVNSMGLGAAEYGGKIYVQGGWNGVLLTNNQEYDFTTNTWAARAPMTVARYQVSSAMTGGLVYCVAGYTSTPVGTNEAYNPATNTWATRASMIQARYLHGVSAQAGMIYSMGGFPNTGTAERYSPGTNTWAGISSLNSARYRITSSASPNCVYALAGFTGSVTVGTNEEFCNAVLDENQLTLRADEENESIRLVWSDPSPDSWYFEIESSVDGDMFSLLKTISGSGWSEYAEEIPLPSTATFYRIRRVSLNGFISYSNVVNISPHSEGPAFDILPSWTDEFIFVEFERVSGEKVEFSILNPEGKIISTAEMSNPPPGKQILSLPIHSTKGIYLVMMKSSGGQVTKRIFR